MTTIISQFAAHETALLTYDAEKKIYLGDNAALSSLYQTMKRWFTKAMLVNVYQYPCCISVNRSGIAKSSTGFNINLNA